MTNTTTSEIFKSSRNRDLSSPALVIALYAMAFVTCFMGLALFVYLTGQKIAKDTPNDRSTDTSTTYITRSTDTSCSNDTQVDHDDSDSDSTDTTDSDDQQVDHDDNAADSDDSKFDYHDDPKVKYPP